MKASGSNPGVIDLVKTLDVYAAVSLDKTDASIPGKQASINMSTGLKLCVKVVPSESTNG